MSDTPSGALLSVRGLRTVLDTARGTFPAVDGLSLELRAGSSLGVVGESGSGKSMFALSVLGLLPRRARIESGELALEGRDLRALSERELRGLRGRKVGMVFQEPLTSFDPLCTIGDQVAESVRRHLGLKAREARGRAEELLATVGIPRPEMAYDQYPLQFSGGMRQRAMIAMALAAEPSLLIADEPTTALDVTIQAQILELLQRLRRERGIALLFISHNLGVIAEIADEVLVMYGGRAMEKAPVGRLFDEPAHPYTKALLEARPTLEGSRARLCAIPGQVPSLESRPGGCPFHPRCGRATEACAREAPPEAAIGPGHSAACWLYGRGGAA